MRIRIPKPSPRRSKACGLVLGFTAQLPLASRRRNQNRTPTSPLYPYTHTPIWKKGHVAEKYFTPELNNKINDICPSSWASFLNSIKFYENAAIKLCKDPRHICAKGSRLRAPANIKRVKAFRNGIDFYDNGPRPGAGEDKNYIIKVQQLLQQSMKKRW